MIPFTAAGQFLQVMQAVKWPDTHLRVIQSRLNELDSSGSSLTLDFYFFEKVWVFRSGSVQGQAEQRIRGHKAYGVQGD